MPNFDQLPPIYFYLPQPFWPADFPNSADENWSGFGLGLYTWTIQTFLRLKAWDFPCQLVNHVPEEGIVFVHHNAFRARKTRLKPSRKLLLICLKAEERPYPYAQLHLVQNPTEASAAKNRFYIPHWPQPGLIPRDPNRGDRFENIAFFGHCNNLAIELQYPSWPEKLASLGLHWHYVINQNKWNDYHSLDNRWNNFQQIDAIVAIRSFQSSHPYNNKPATKLFNAWLAGVPALLGIESAYRFEGCHLEDYWEINTYEELINSLQCLKSDKNLRQQLVTNGYSKAIQFTPENISKKWQDFILDIAVPSFYRWCNLPALRQSLLLQQQYLTHTVEKVQSKLKIIKPKNEAFLLSTTR